MSTIDLAVLEKYTNEQLYNYLRSVSNEEKREIWNALSKESKSTITNLTDYLKETTVEVTVTKGKYKGEKR